MADPEPIPLPRACSVTSHQFHMNGVCLAITEKGEAIVEDHRGGVHVYRIDGEGYHMLTFTDRNDA